jgi:DNA replication protein DnaC
MESSEKAATGYRGECEKHGQFDGTIMNLLGREFKSRCPECLRIMGEESEAREREQEDTRRRRALSEKLGSAAIPARFTSKTFDCFKVSNDRQQKALDACVEYAENFMAHRREGRCLMLMGKPGTGKSHLAAAIANHLVRKTLALAVYRTVAGLLIEIKESYDRGSNRSEAQVMRALSSPDLLILDEVGATKPSEFELAMLFAVINSRYENQLPTLVVSNLPPKELAGAIGDRCVDRLREGGGIVVGFDWESMRGAL